MGSEYKHLHSTELAVSGMEVCVDNIDKCLKKIFRIEKVLRQLDNEDVNSTRDEDSIREERKDWLDTLSEVIKLIQKDRDQLLHGMDNVRYLVPNDE
jgi:hypothetical protein